MKKQLILSLLAAAAVAGCSSTKLNETPVSDGSAAGAGNGSTGSQVASVEAGQAGLGAGPSAEVSRVVYFDFDKYDVKAEYRPVVAANAQWLKANPSGKVVLEGNTDERGSAEYNLALGQKRAESVRQALQLLGVSDSQMEAISYGKERPAVDGHDEAAWAKNRRVDFSYR